MSYFIFSNLCHVCETQCMLYSCRNSQSRPAMLQLVKCFTGVQIRHGNSEWGISWQMVQRHPNKRKAGGRDICTVLMGLPIYRATFQYAKREYKIIFEVSRSHFHSIFQRMTLYIILGRAYFEISKHTWNSGASLMLRENQNDPCNVQNILKIFFRKHISVLPVRDDKSPPGTHPRLTGSS